MFTYYTDHVDEANHQMNNFIDLLKEKIEAEFTWAEAMAKLAEFPIDKLMNTPFENVAMAIKWWAQNEANIVYDFVEDIWNDIYEPTSHYFEDM